MHPLSSICIFCLSSCLITGFSTQLSAADPIKFGETTPALPKDLPESYQAALKAVQTLEDFWDNIETDNFDYLKTSQAYDDLIRSQLPLIQAGYKNAPTFELKQPLLKTTFECLCTLADRSQADAKALSDFLDALQAHDDPHIKRFASCARQLRRLATACNGTPEQRDADLSAVTEFVLSQPIDDNSEHLARELVTLLEMTEQPQNGSELLKKLAAHLNTSDSHSARKLALTAQGIIRRLSLPGQQLEITGTTRDGKPFDLKSLRGNVVVIDFWATWCGPCIAEIPYLIECRSALHSHGFEVVGISLDESATALNAFLSKSKISYPILADPAEQGDSQHSNNPPSTSWAEDLATRYGVIGIPTVFLIDQKGTVISIDARGPELQRLLTELFPDQHIPPYEEQARQNADNEKPAENGPNPETKAAKDIQLDAP